MRARHRTLPLSCSTSICREMDGFETASLIRARERSQSTPIIFLTADDRTGARVLEGYRLGAVDYLYKPFDADILRAKVAVFVDLFRKTAALEQRTTELTQVSAALARHEQQVISSQRRPRRTCARADGGAGGLESGSGSGGGRAFADRSDAARQ